MESFGFELRLVDQISNAAKKGAGALRGVETQAKKTQEALDFSKELGRAQAALSKLKLDPSGFVKTQKALREIQKEKEKLLKGAGMGGGGGSGGFMGNLFGRLGFGRLVGAAAIGTLIGDGIIKGADALVSGAEKAVSILTDGIKFAFQKAGTEEATRLSERLTLGDKGGPQFAADVKRFAKMTAFDEQEIRTMIIPLRQYGMSQQQTRTMFAAASDAAVGRGHGGDVGFVKDVLEQFTRIRLLGHAQERSLVSIGVDTQQLYNDIAKKQHISAKAAKTQVESGGLPQGLLLHEIYSQIRQHQHGELGTGSVEYGKTFEGRMRRLHNLTGDFFRRIVESPAFGKASDAIGSLLEKLDPDGPAGQRIIGALTHAFEKITDVFGGSGDAAQDIADALASMVEYIADLIPNVAKLGRDLIAMADKLELMIDKARLFNAYVTGNKKDRERIEGEIADHARQKALDKFHEKEEAERIRGRKAGEKYVGDTATVDALNAGFGAVGLPISIGKPMVADYVGTPGKGGQDRSQIHIHVTGNTTPENANEIGRKAGEAATDHIDRHSERSARRAGALR